MKLLVNSLLVTAAAGIGLTVGSAIRGTSTHRTPELQGSPAPVAVSEAKLGGALQGKSAGRFRDDSPLATSLERDLSMSSGVTRWLYWLDALENAAPADFPRLARLANGNPAAMRLLAAQWVERAPRHLFDTLVAASRNRDAGFPSAELADALFKEWPKRDPDAVLAALDSLQDFGLRDKWRWRVVNPIFDGDVERGLRLFSQWHIEDYGPFMTSVAKWAAADPRHAAEYTIANQAGFVSRLTMEEIGKQWAQTDPAGALAFAATQPGQLGSALATSTLKQWAAQNLTDAGTWLAGADTQTRNSLYPALVEVWAQKDAASALAWCQDNLSGTSLAQAVGAVIKGAAGQDANAAAALVTSLSPSPARAEAAVAVAQKWFPGLSSDQTVKPETLAWLAGLDSDAIKRVVGAVEWGWATSDPKSMSAFLALAKPEQIPPEAYPLLARELSRKDPAGTLDWASHLPAEWALPTVAAAFGQWQGAQPEAALKWLNELSSDDPRRAPCFESAVQNLANGSESQATGRLAAMSPADRAAAQRVIEGLSYLSSERRNRLLDALKPR